MDATNLWFNESFDTTHIGNSTNTVPHNKAEYYVDDLSKLSKVSEWHDRTPYATAYVPCNLLVQLAEQHIELQQFGGNLDSIVRCVTREDTMSNKLSAQLTATRQENASLGLELARNSIRHKTSMQSCMSAMINNMDDNVAVAQNLYRTNTNCS